MIPATLILTSNTTLREELLTGIALGLAGVHWMQQFSWEI